MIQNLKIASNKMLAQKIAHIEFSPLKHTEFITDTNRWAWTGGMPGIESSILFRGECQLENRKLTGSWANAIFESAKKDTEPRTKKSTLRQKGHVY